MFTKFMKVVAALAVILSIFGSGGSMQAAHAASPAVSSRSLAAARPPQNLPQPMPELSLPPASSLGVQFLHIATAANTSAQKTALDHPLINGDPNAILFVTPNLAPGGGAGVYDDHPIGVYYFDGSWYIFNQDAGTMLLGAAFNVIIPTPGTGVFVHTATAANSNGDWTSIDNPLTNDNPNALLLVTPNWNPGGVGGTNNNHPIGVYYNGAQWTIFNQDLTAIPEGAAFNVLVLSPGPGVFIHTAVPGNTSDNVTIIDNSLTNGQPNALVFITPNYDPGYIYDNSNIGVYYDGIKWAIFNQDMAAMPLWASFNVLVLVPSSAVFIHTASTENINGNATWFDNALTNGHPYAFAFITHNYNPGGTGGPYLNHNTGVYYNLDGWSAFNQDEAAIQNGVAFNVLVPHPDANVFIHRATAINTSAHVTIIDHLLTNYNPDALLLVTPNWNPGGVGVYDDHPIGVYYAGTRWAIINQDLATMPVGAAFNVIVLSPGAGVFVHSATVTNTVDHISFIDHPRANDNPNAILLVTPNWNPGGVGGVYNAHPIGVYSAGSRWAIYNEDLAAMPVGAAFNVYVFGNFKVYLPFICK